MSIPKVNIEQIGLTMKELENEPDKCKEIFKYWFSDIKNIDTFSKFIYPEYIHGDVPEFHKEFYEVFNEDGHDALGAPRGHAKSTTIGLVYISWNLVNKIEKYIVYMSQNHSKTVQFIEPINVEFKTNNRLRWLYGDLSPKKNKDEFGRDREDCIDINGCRVEAVSYNKNLRGFKYGNMRPTLIIGDDIDDDERVVNPVMREKDRNKLLEVVINSLDINGRFKIVGTIIHHDSLLKTCLRKFNGKVYKAIRDDGTILWPARFSEEKLTEIRDGKDGKEGIGSSAFEKEYQNNPVDNESSIIKREWIEQCFINKSSDELDFDELYLGVDFAFSDKVSADDSAFADIGVNYHSNSTVKELIFLNGEWCHGLSPKNHWVKIKSKHEANHHDMVLLEENSIKSSSDSVKDMNVPFRQFWTGNRDSQKDFSPSNKSKTISKINAINRLASLFEYKKIIIPYKTEHEKKIANKLLGELCSWGLMDGKLIETGEHPDMPVAIFLVNEYIRVIGGVA